MDWITVSNLIIAIGLPAATAIVAKWEAKAQVTSAELTALAALTDRRGKDRAMQVMKDNGIDPTSQVGITLLSLVQ